MIIAGATHLTNTNARWQLILMWWLNNSIKFNLFIRSSTFRVAWRNNSTWITFLTSSSFLTFFVFGPCYLLILATWVPFSFFTFSYFSLSWSLAFVFLMRSTSMFLMFSFASASILVMSFSFFMLRLISLLDFLFFFFSIIVFPFAWADRLNEIIEIVGIDFMPFEVHFI